MVPLDAVYHDPRINCLLDMKPGDLFRDGRVYHYPSLAPAFTHPTELVTQLGMPVVRGLLRRIWAVFQRIIYWIQDVIEAYRLTGNFHLIKANGVVDKNEFEKIYPMLSGRVRELQGRFDRGEGKNLETFSELKHLLKLYTKVRLSWAGKRLRSEEGNSFNQLREDLKRLRLAATPVVREWAQEKPILERINLKRWIESTSFQRKFATWYDDDELPWMMDDIPVGTVLLDDPELGAVGHALQNHTLTFNQQFQRVRAQGAGVFTGIAMNHASLYIGDRTIFHIDNPEKITKGLGVQDRYPRVPGKKEKPLYRSHPMVPHASVEQIEQVVGRARSHGSEMLADMWSILGAGFGKRKRGPDYTYDPETPRLYACSSAIADLFYRAGIDVGAGNGLKIEKFSPADYVTSSSFHKFTERDVAAPDLSLLAPEDRTRVYHLIWEAMGRPTGPGTERIGEEQAYFDIPRLRQAVHDAAVLAG